MNRFVKILILILIISWYGIVRSIVYYYFLGCPSNGRNCDFFDWWWSWIAAIPVTALSLFALEGTVCWIIKE